MYFIFSGHATNKYIQKETLQILIKDYRSLNRNLMQEIKMSAKSFEEGGA